MVEQKHTPEPWAKNGTRVESEHEHGWANDGWIICGLDGPDAEENARRIVACVNWCAGNSTKGMELAVEIGRPYSVERDSAIERELEVTKQRDLFKDAAEYNKRRAEDAEMQRDELEFSLAGCSQQLKDACADLDGVEKDRDQLRAELAQALAACKAKDSGIEHILTNPNGAWVYVKLGELLSIEPDDAALKVWLGEPVWVYSKDLKLVNEFGFNKLMVDDTKRGMADTPLYSPKELK